MSVSFYFKNNIKIFKCYFNSNKLRGKNRQLRKYFIKNP